SQGQLGDGTTIDRHTPTFALQYALVLDKVVPELLDNVVALAAGDFHTCAAYLSGAYATCWGSDAQGQRGDGNALVPYAFAGSDVLIMASCGVWGFNCDPYLHNIVALAAGGNHACALRADGLVRCWGDNDVYQLGNGSTLESTYATPP